MRVSVYVPAFESERTLQACLDSILRQSHPVDEILVVDDGSSDRTASIARSAGVSVVRHGTNRGVAAARNSGFRESGGDYVAAVDSDCVLEPDWLRFCIEAFEQTGVAAVGGRLLENDTTTALGVWRSMYMKHHWGDMPVHNPDFLSGSNTVIRRSAFHEIGPYDERFRLNFEDVDLSTRLRRGGFDLLYRPEAVAWHLRHDTLRSALRRYWGWNSYLHEGRVFRRAIFHLGRSLGSARNDLASGRPHLALVDAISFPTSLYYDLEASLRRGSRRSDGT